MEHVGKRLSCAEANKMDMVSYLATIGIEPAKTRANECWYISPFREEFSPSFKVDRRINKWYDHGEGKGGNLVDFCLLYYRCTIPELLEKLCGTQRLARPIKQVQKITTDQGNHIVVTEVKPLNSPALLQYAESRAIPKEIAQKFCKEVSYINGGKNYYAIGFKNDLGGYELRSKYFKGSSAPKGITHQKNGHRDLTVFEGFFSFLSFQAQHESTGLPPSDFLILNSLSFFEKSRYLMDTYPKVNLMLDNDAAGRKFTSLALGWGNAYQDSSGADPAHKDINEKLMSEQKANRIKRRQGRYL